MTMMPATVLLVSASPQAVKIIHRLKLSRARHTASEQSTGANLGRGCLLKMRTSALGFGSLRMMRRRGSLALRGGHVFRGVCDGPAALGHLFRRHQVASQAGRVDLYRFEVRLPHLELLLSIRQNLSCVVGMGERLANVSRNDRRVVEIVQQAAAVLCKNNLLLSTLNGGGKLQVICFLDLLASLFMVRGTANARDVAILTMLVSWASATRF